MNPDWDYWGLKTLRTGGLGEFLSKVCTVLSKVFSCEKFLNLLERIKIDAQIRIASQTLNAVYCRPQAVKSNTNQDTTTKTKTNEAFRS